MSNVITKRVRVSRRLFLKGLSAAQTPVIVGLPPLISMFNSNGTAYAAETDGAAPAMTLKLPPKARDGTLTFEVPTGGTSEANFEF